MTPEQEAEFGPWEIFNGGPCPLKEGELAQVRLKNEKREEVERQDERCLVGRDVWLNASGIIRAYRRVIEPKPRVAIGHVHQFGEEEGENFRSFAVTITGDEIEASWID